MLQVASRKINNIFRLTYLSNSGATDIAFDWPDGSHDGEYNGVGIVEMPEIFSTQDALSLE